MIRSTSLALALILAAVAAHAGVYYEQVVRTEGAGRRGSGEQVIRSWVEGPSARIEMSGAGSSNGSYLVTRDGGDTIYFVDTAAGRYYAWDLDSAFAALGAIQDSMPGLLEMDFSDASSEVLAERPGEEILGFATTEVETETSYTLEMKVFGRGKKTTNTSRTRIWLTDEIPDTGMSFWARPKLPSTGDPEWDAHLREQMERGAQGVVLRSIDETTTVGKKGRSQTVTTRTDVRELRRESISAERFEIPDHFTEIEVPDLESAPEGSGPLSGLRSIIGQGRGE